MGDGYPETGDGCPKTGDGLSSSVLLILDTTSTKPILLAVTATM
jgi:hypothetical protein